MPTKKENVIELNIPIKEFKYKLKSIIEYIDTPYDQDGDYVLKELKEIQKAIK